MKNTFYKHYQQIIHHFFSKCASDCPTVFREFPRLGFSSHETILTCFSVQSKTDLFLNEISIIQNWLIKGRYTYDVHENFKTPTPLSSYVQNFDVQFQTTPLQMITNQLKGNIILELQSYVIRSLLQVGFRFL